MCSARSLIRRSWKRKPKKDLRDVICEKYGEPFAHKYDLLNLGIPIGGIEETMDFLAKVNKAKPFVTGERQEHEP